MPFKTYVNASAGAGAGGMAPIASPSGGSGGPGAGGWHPTVLYMLALVVAEIAAVAWISKHL
jgi:hypothetical protein